MSFLYPARFRFPLALGALLAILPALYFALLGNQYLSLTPHWIATPKGIFTTESLSLAFFQILCLAPLALVLLYLNETPRWPFFILGASWTLLTLVIPPHQDNLPSYLLILALLALPVFFRLKKHLIYLAFLFVIGAGELLTPAISTKIFGYQLHSKNTDLFRVVSVLVLFGLGLGKTIFHRHQNRRVPNFLVNLNPDLLKHPLLEKTLTGSTPAIPHILCGLDPSGLKRLAQTPPLSCAILNQLSSGPWACREACLQGYDCVKICPQGALSPQGSGTPSLKEEKCLRCGLCASICPKKLIKFIPDHRVLIECLGQARMKEMDALCAHGCLGCGLCRKACPFGALSKPKQYPPRISYEICVQNILTCAYACVKACPRGVLRARDLA
jgi:Fe-S-cluster-containing hydrogenase component 2